MQDGTVNERATGSPYFFEYILKGEGVETWQPRFSYYGMTVFTSGYDSKEPEGIDRKWLK